MTDQTSNNLDRDIRSLLQIGASIHRLEDLYGRNAVHNVAQEFISSERARGNIGGRLAPLLLLRATSANLDALLKNDDIVDDVLQSLVADPEDSMLLDPIMQTWLKDPVVLSSGFVVDRSTACDHSGNLRFHDCPFSRAPLERKVYPVVPLKNKIKKFELRRINRCEEVAKKFVDAKDWTNAEKVFEIAEELLRSLGDATYRHVAKRLADLERSGPGMDRPEKALKIYTRLIRGASGDEIGALVVEAMEECLRNASKFVSDESPERALEWIGNGPSTELFGLLRGRNFTDLWSHLKMDRCKLLLRCAKLQSNERRIWSLRRELMRGLTGEELSSWLESEGLSGEEFDLRLPDTYDPILWPQGVWLESTMGIAAVGPSYPDLQCTADLSPEPHGNHWVEVAFKPMKIENNSSKNSIFSQHGAGTGWEVRCGSQGVELVWTTATNHNESFHHNEFFHVLDSGLKIGQWYHVAVAFEASSSELTLFVDGESTKKTINGTFRKDRRLPLLGRNPCWSDRNLVGLVAFPSAATVLPCSVEGLETFVAQLASERLTSLREWDRTRIRLTSAIVPENVNPLQACKEEFGEGTRLLDFYDLTRMKEEEVEKLKNDFGILRDTTYNVTYKGEIKYSGNRLYYFNRHDGPAPSNWLVHKSHAGLTLGSWMGMYGKWLCATSDTINRRDRIIYDDDDSDDDNNSIYSDYS